MYCMVRGYQQTFSATLCIDFTVASLVSLLGFGILTSIVLPSIIGFRFKSEDVRMASATFFTASGSYTVMDTLEADFRVTCAMLDMTPYDSTGILWNLHVDRALNIILRSYIVDLVIKQIQTCS